VPEMDAPAGSCGGPALGWDPVQAEHAQAGQVDRGGQQVEVGGDLGKAADPHAAAAVAAADQMGEPALDLGPGRAVVGGAAGVGVAGAGLGQLVLVGGDGDAAAARAGGALPPKRAALAGRAEAGLAVVAVARVGYRRRRRPPPRYLPVSPAIAITAAAKTQRPPVIQQPAHHNSRAHPCGQPGHARYGPPTVPLGALGSKASRAGKSAGRFRPTSLVEEARQCDRR
jgi:hypothetical protein